MTIKITSKTNQEVFDRAVEYFRTHTKRCTFANKGPVYSDGEGNHCVLGAQMDYPPIYAQEDPIAAKRIFKLIENKDVDVEPGINLYLLDDLQSMHDSSNRVAVTEERLENVACYYRLKMPALVVEEEKVLQLV